MNRIRTQEAKEAGYCALVRQSLTSRIRFISLCIIPFYLGFAVLDWIVYDDWVTPLLYTRLPMSAFLVAFYLLVRFRTLGVKQLLAVGSGMIIVIGVGVAVMIYQVDELRSDYYQGLNLVMLAMLSINHLYAIPNLISGIILIIAYVIAIVTHELYHGPEILFSSIFFMVSTLTFVVIMTKFYSIHHRRQYEQAWELRMNAEALDRAHNRLKEQERIKDRFFANVSHELRTPLTLILGPLRKLLADSNLSDQVRYDLEVMERNTDLLAKQVNDLLDLSKLDEGRMEPTYVRVDVESFLRVASSHFQTLAEEKNIRFTFEFFTNSKPEVERPFFADIDPTKFERIVFNILSNAFKFTPDGGEVKCVLQAKADSFQVIVLDSGPGIDPDSFELVFERYRQVEGSESRRLGGSGLGLAIVKELTELHRGKVAVSNRPEGGARFVVEIPRSAPANADVKRWQTAYHKSSLGIPVAIAGSAPNQVKRTTADSRPLVLIVEDHDDMRNFLVDTISSSWNTISARDGLEGLEVARHHQPDLIIADLMMPEMNGEELLIQLAKDPALSKIPVMLMTARTDVALRERLLREGAMDFLTKPFAIGEIMARASNLLQMKGARDVLEREVLSQGADLTAIAEQLTDHKRNLEQALHDSEEAARQKDEFLLNLSHELRTPLTAILGWADILKSSELSKEDLQVAFDTIDRNAQAELKLVNDLLDISRIIQGKMTLSLVYVDLRALVESVVELFRPAIEAKLITLSLTYSDADVLTMPKDNSMVLCDPDRIRQVLRNLLDNALKFTPEGGQISVELALEADEVEITVDDSGEGIDSEMTDVIFQRLRQLDGSITRRHGGLGLGLPIAKHLVELHGGKITANSKGKGMGTRMIVRLPRRASFAQPND